MQNQERFQNAFSRMHSHWLLNANHLIGLSEKYLKRIKEKYSVGSADTTLSLNTLMDLEVFDMIRLVFKI